MVDATGPVPVPAPVKGAIAVMGADEVRPVLTDKPIPAPSLALVPDRLLIFRTGDPMISSTISPRASRLPNTAPVSAPASVPGPDLGLEGDTDELCLVVEGGRGIFVGVSLGVDVMVAVVAERPRLGVFNTPTSGSNPTSPLLSLSELLDNLRPLLPLPALIFNTPCPSPPWASADCAAVPVAEPEPEPEPEPPAIFGR